MIAKLIEQLILEPELDSLTFRADRDNQFVISWRSQRGDDGPLLSLNLVCPRTKEGLRACLLRMLEQINEIDHG